jgi:hypothetical protein
MTANGTSEATTGVTAGLGKLALNWPTVVLILATSGGNFFAIERERTARHADLERAFRQIGELHDAMDDSEKHQKQGLDGLNVALKAHNEELDGIRDTLKNRLTMLANEHEKLSAVSGASGK